MKSLPRSIARLLASGLVAFGLFVSGGPALAADYTITDLGNLGGSSYATGINASGQVVGYSSTPYETEHAFLYSSGTMQDLGTLGGSNSQAYGINASGQVVGGSGIAGNSYCYDAFLSMRDLGLGGSFSQANGINDSGQVVGTFTNEWDEQHAFLYNNGTMQDLGTIGGASSSAYGINASGQVVGASTWTSLSDYGHAFLYSNGKMQDLGTLGGIYGSSAYGINASGQVVGYSYITGAGNNIFSNVFHAFLYSNGTMQDLGTLGGSDSQANGINDSGEVVGESDTTNDSAQHAFLYSNGSMTDLNSLISPSSGWTLLDATAVNDNGQIAGYGVNPEGNDEAFLLTPNSNSVPLPPALLLLAPGLVGLAAARRRLKK